MARRSPAPQQSERGATNDPSTPAQPGSWPGEDVELLRRLRAGEEAAFASLVDAWSGSMLRVAVAHVRSRALAEEAVQDTWIAVLRGLAGFEGRSSLKTWVFRILTYTCRAKLERERRVPPLSDVLRPDELGAGPVVAVDRFLSADHPRWPGHWSRPPVLWARRPDEVLLDDELRHRIAEAVARLPQRQRAVLTLRDIEGFTADEVCALLGLQAGNQRVLLHRARSAVRASLEDYLSVEAR